jgi:hypothetical protein
MTVDPVSRLSAKSAAEFSNEEFLLIGGVSSDTGVGSNTACGSYAVYDARLLAAGSVRSDAVLGRVEISLYPRSLLIEGLNRMEIASRRRQRGAGRRLIQALAATAPDFQLTIYDIRPAALDFWIALGCTFKPCAEGEGWDACYSLPAGLRPPVPDRHSRAEAMLRA